MPVFQVETNAGTAVRAGLRRLVPFSQVIKLIPPGEASAGLIWNRPVAVLVQEPDGTERVLRIPDITRQAQILLLALGLFGAFLIWLANRGLNVSNSQEES